MFVFINYTLLRLEYWKRAIGVNFHEWKKLEAHPGTIIYGKLHVIAEHRIHTVGVPMP